MKKLHIQLKPDQKIFFTSDLHLGHRNVISFCKRPFEDVKTMNKTILDNINKSQVYFDDQNGKRVIIDGGIIINEEN